MDIRGFFNGAAKTAKKPAAEVKQEAVVVDLADSDEEAQTASPKKRRLKTGAERQKEKDVKAEEAKVATPQKAKQSSTKQKKATRAKKSTSAGSKAAKKKKKRTYGDSDDNSGGWEDSSSDDEDEEWNESGSESSNNDDEEEEFVSENEGNDDEAEDSGRGKKRKKTTKTSAKAAAKSRTPPSKTPTRSKTPAAAKKNLTEVSPGAFFGDTQPAAASTTTTTTTTTTKTASAAPATATTPVKKSKHFASEEASTPSKGTKRAMPWEKSAPKSPVSAKKATPAKKPKLPEVDSTPVGPLANLTFVITGELSSLTRDQAEDLIKEHGGRVTSAVSGKTSFLVAGERLEDGRPVDTSSKYQKAKSLQEAKKPVKIISEDELLAMVNSLAAEVSESKAAELPPVVNTPNATIPVATSSSSSSQPLAAAGSHGNELWADKYMPQTMDDIVGHQSIAKKLEQWLMNWDRVHITKELKPAFSTKEYMGAKAALLSGPPGIGKTTLAQVVGRHLGYEILEMNASDTRNKSSVEEMLTDAAVSCAISSVGGGIRRRLIIMDEVDGMSTSDRGGNQALIQVIKKARTPIICICNDRQKNSVRSLANSCLDLKVARPLKASMVKRLQQICQAEGMHAEPNALELLVESCGNDFRQSLNALQMWSRSSNQVNFRSMKEGMNEISKDKVLRMSPFDAVRTIISEVQTTSFRDRFDAFFIDYSLTPLLVQQNYVKAVESGTRGLSDDAIIDRLAQAADAASDSELVGKMISGGDQHWYLLPTQAAMNVRVGQIARGGIGQPGFPEWLGKYSTKTKKHRLTSELAMHMSLAYSGSFESLRLHYVPALRDMLLNSLLTDETNGIAAVIELLDAYGLSKDDFMENMKELQLGPSSAYDKIDSKVKAALTREFNKLSHRSQALVRSSQATKPKRGTAASSSGDADGGETEELDGENGQAVEEEEAEDEDVSMFVKKAKGRAASSAAGKAAKATSKAAASSKGKGKAKAK